MKIKELINQIILQEMKSLKEYAVLTDEGSDDFSIKDITTIFKGLKYEIKLHAENAFSSIKEIKKNLFLIGSFEINKNAEYSLKFTVDNSKDRPRSTSTPFNKLNNELGKFTIGTNSDDLFLRLDNEKIGRVLKNKILIVENFVKQNARTEEV